VTIELLGLELHGFHGVLEQERREGQRFLVDVWLDPLGDAGASSDRIEDAVDYRRVVAIVQEVSDGRAYHLLEALATALAEELLERLAAGRVRVRVRKPEVRLALPVEHAAVLVERYRGVTASRYSASPTERPRETAT
jgi:dihydroneopterin aldolase